MPGGDPAARRPIPIVGGHIRRDQYFISIFYALVFKGFNTFRIYKIPKQTAITRPLLYDISREGDRAPPIPVVGVPTPSSKLPLVLIFIVDFII